MHRLALCGRLFRCIGTTVTGTPTVLGMRLEVHLQGLWMLTIVVWFLVSVVSARGTAVDSGTGLLRG